MILKLVKDKISLDELQEIAKEYYVTMIKGVADVSKEILVFGGEYHMDANIKILETGSSQADVWGFNVHFDKPRTDWIEFTSLINIRPAAGNMSIEIADKTLQKKIQEIVNSKII